MSRSSEKEITERALALVTAGSDAQAAASVLHDLDRLQIVEVLCCVCAWVSGLLDVLSLTGRIDPEEFLANLGFDIATDAYFEEFSE